MVIARLVLLLVLGTLCAADVPYWVLSGIARTETSSSVSPEGQVTWVDHRVGAAGELGAFQMGPAAFKDSGTKGSFQELQRDPQFALVAAKAYLLVLRGRWGSWRAAVQAYNAGHPGTHAGAAYLLKVTAPR